MPEGPEVKLLVIELNKILKNKVLFDIELLSGRYIKKPDNFDNFINNLPLKIIEVKNRGKFIYFILENNWFIFNTLGMTGNWTIMENVKHNRLKNLNLKKMKYFIMMLEILELLNLLMI